MLFMYSKRKQNLKKSGKYEVKRERERGQKRERERERCSEVFHTLLQKISTLKKVLRDSNNNY